MDVLVKNVDIKLLSRQREQLTAILMGRQSNVSETDLWGIVDMLSEMETAASNPKSLLEEKPKAGDKEES